MGLVWARPCNPLLQDKCQGCSSIHTQVLNSETYSEYIRDTFFLLLQKKNVLALFHSTLLWSGCFLESARGTHQLNSQPFHHLRQICAKKHISFDKQTGPKCLRVEKLTRKFLTDVLKEGESAVTTYVHAVPAKCLRECQYCSSKHCP